MIDRDVAARLIGVAIEASDADDLIVQVGETHRSHLRYANNQVTTSGRDQDLHLSVTASYGSRTATASGNQHDHADIVAVVEAAQDLARVAPEDPEYLPSVGPQLYLGVDAHTDIEQPDAMQTGAAQVIAEAESRGLVAAGFVQAHQSAQALGTSNGCLTFHRQTRANVSTTVRTANADGSGWAADTASQFDRLDFQRLGAIAADKAERSVGRRPLEPGRYLTILEPACVANLVDTLRRSLNQRRTDEGRSFLSKPDGDRVGETLFPTWVNASSNPADPRVPTSPFASNGLPHAKRQWIQDGAITRLPCSRFWAQKTDRAADPAPPNWLMSGGDQTLDQLIAKTEQGVLVTSLWYIRSVDPRKLLLTGLTRDGVFWIQDGQISHPLTNMRWNDSPIDVLANAIDATVSTRAAARSRGGGNAVVPAIRTAAFHFTSASEAV